MAVLPPTWKASLTKMYELHMTVRARSLRSAVASGPLYRRTRAKKRMAVVRRVRRAVPSPRRIANASGWVSLMSST